MAKPQTQQNQYSLAENDFHPSTSSKHQLTINWRRPINCAATMRWLVQ